MVGQTVCIAVTNKKPKKLRRLAANAAGNSNSIRPKLFPTKKSRNAVEVGLGGKLETEIFNYVD